MLRSIILVIVLFISTHHSTAQTFWVPKTPLLQFLYELKKPVPEISNMGIQRVLPVQFYKIDTQQKIIKNKNGLFVLLDGSGQVYKATDIANDKIAFTRVDSTFISGNSFHSYNFSYKDTLFNFGGYGYWRANGLLSYFKEGNEWNIVKINKEYQAVDILHNYLPDDSKLFYVQIPIKEEFTQNKAMEKPLVIQLDLNNKSNTVLGRLSNEINFPNSAFTVNIHSLQGVLIPFKRDLFLLNFSKNAVYKLTNAAFINEFSDNNHSFIKNTFEIDHKLYYTLEPEHLLRSIKISMSDFKVEPYPIYIPIRSQSNWLWIITGVVLVFIMAALYIIRHRTRHNIDLPVPINSTFNPVQQSRSSLQSLEFSSLEQDLIRQIIIKSKNGNLFTVDEMNTGLGLGRKAMEIQKKIRTESINRINHKFKVNYNQQADLIERVRSEEDRRYFHYAINDANALIYNSESSLK